MLLWKMILAAAALKGRKACAQHGRRARSEIGKQALSGPFAGMEASLVEVSYPPGGRSAEHRHPGFIVGYVLEGQIRFAINHETPRGLRRGEMFYEPTGALHSPSENAQNASAAPRYCSRENSRVTFTGTPATIASTMARTPSRVAGILITSSVGGRVRTIPWPPRRCKQCRGPTAAKPPMKPSHRRRWCDHGSAEKSSAAQVTSSSASSRKSGSTDSPSRSFSRIGASYSLLFLMTWSKIVGFEVSPVTDSSSM